jgi:hypothetical protein
VKGRRADAADVNVVPPEMNVDVGDTTVLPADMKVVAADRTPLRNERR